MNEKEEKKEDSFKKFLNMDMMTFYEAFVIAMLAIGVIIPVGCFLCWVWNTRL